MAFTHFSHNGAILPIDQAVIPLSSVEYSYGFGVYETIRVSKGKIHFLEEHCQRLMESARILTLQHIFTNEFVADSVKELVKKLAAETCNIKLLLVGGPTKESANLYIMALNPLFPDRKLYKTGVHCITVEYQRDYPHAKSLNMLPSYLAYRQAKSAGAYDALLINRQGNITEGTRTNFLALKDKTIVSPPTADILLGVARGKVLQAAKTSGFKIIEQDIKPADLAGFDAAFLTSTSSKIMPIRSIDNHQWPAIPENLKQLMSAFN
ncbi:hypothetical protein COY17_02105 [Candidatus Saccharibacteria bacterium CG_4_10_14_0_2_um_filter_52_9]|nr:MAG: hypothetical protein COY17_02105 [Candidatus Saccharibacteria bacterium CG_4_10_14_0_2_um_filter_52_9]